MGAAGFVVIASADGVEVLAPAPRVFVVAPSGETVIVGGRAKRRPAAATAIEAAS